MGCNQSKAATTKTTPVAPAPAVNKQTEEIAVAVSVAAPAPVVEQAAAPAPVEEPVATPAAVEETVAPVEETVAPVEEPATPVVEEPSVAPTEEVVEQTPATPVADVAVAPTIEADAIPAEEEKSDVDTEPASPEKPKETVTFEELPAAPVFEIAEETPKKVVTPAPANNKKTGKKNANNKKSVANNKKATANNKKAATTTAAFGRSAAVAKPFEKENSPQRSALKKSAPATKKPVALGVSALNFASPTKSFEEKRAVHFTEPKKAATKKAKTNKHLKKPNVNQDVYLAQVAAFERLLTDASTLNRQLNCN